MDTINDFTRLPTRKGIVTQLPNDSSTSSLFSPRKIYRNPSPGSDTGTLLVPFIPIIQIFNSWLPDSSPTLLSVSLVTCTLPRTVVPTVTAFSVLVFPRPCYSTGDVLPSRSHSFLPFHKPPDCSSLDVVKNFSRLTWIGTIWEEKKSSQVVCKYLKEKVRIVRGVMTSPLFTETLPGKVLDTIGRNGLWVSVNK